MTVTALIEAEAASLKMLSRYETVVYCAFCGKITYRAWTFPDGNFKTKDDTEATFQHLKECEKRPQSIPAPLLEGHVER